MTTGISATTQDGIVYGPAYCTVNGTTLGALTGDCPFEMSTEEFYPDFSEAYGPVAGTGKVVAGSGKITVTMTEWTYSVLSTLFSMGASSTADSQKLGSGTLGTITELTNVIILGFTKNNGKDMRVTIPKARVTSPLASTVQKGENSTLEVTFESLVTGGAPKTMPMWIEIEI